GSFRDLAGLHVGAEMIEHRRRQVAKQQVVAQQRQLVRAPYGPSIGSGGLLLIHLVRLAPEWGVFLFQGDGSPLTFARRHDGPFRPFAFGHQFATFRKAPSPVTANSRRVTGASDRRNDSHPVVLVMVHRAHNAYQSDTFNGCTRSTGSSEV